MSFDFEAFLRSIDPTQAYKITRLTGGIVNITVRAVKQTKSDDDTGRFPGHRSLVLKHATPYVAGVGEHVPMTTKRQEIEAKMLSLFEPKSVLGDVQEKAGIQVPELLYHNAEHHIIVLSDLGYLDTLSSLCSNLGGWVPPDPWPPSDKPNAAGVSLRIDDQIRFPSRVYFPSVGTRLGQFFGHMHSPAVLNLIVSHPSFGLNYLENESMRQSVLDYVTALIRPRLTQFTDMVGSSVEVEELAERAVQNMVRATLDDERSLSLGDCWPGGILLSSPRVRSVDTPISFEVATNNPVTVCVIDFEFASLGRGPHGDVAQLLAHLECFLMVARFKELAYETEVLEMLIDSFIRSYRSISLAETAAWLENCGRVTHVAPQPGSLRARVVRSALLSMAAEMLNVAFWKVWPCERAECSAISMGHPIGQPNAHDEDQIHLCPLIRYMVSTVVWLLRQAGQHEDEICKQRNWDELLSGPPGLLSTNPNGSRRLWLVDLFM